MSICCSVAGRVVGRASEFTSFLFPPHPSNANPTYCDFTIPASHCKSFDDFTAFSIRKLLFVFISVLTNNSSTLPLSQSTGLSTITCHMKSHKDTL